MSYDVSDNSSRTTEHEETWFGEIPGRWSRARVKTLFRLRTELSGLDHGKELLSVYSHIGVRPRKELEARGNRATTTDNYWIVRSGDLIVNKLLAWMGAIGVSNYEGVTSPAYDILKPIQELDSTYYHHLFRLPYCLGEFKRRSRGIMDMRLRLYFDQFGQVLVPVPPLEEQHLIVHYVRHLDSKVNRLIKAKWRLVELLNEQKQAIIHQAVTQGLNPTVSLRPSGIEWLGNVPEHWAVKPLKRWASINARTLTDKTASDFEFRYLDIGTVGTGHLTREPEKMSFDNAPSRARRIVRNGDTIISTVRTYLKAMFFIEVAEETIIASTGFAVLSPTSVIVPRYLSYLVQSSDFINRVAANSTGIAYPAISESQMGTFHLAAPELGEQYEILAHLDFATEPFDSALMKARTEIDLIREFRTRLVADIVTGQLDVRHLNLPDVDAQLEALGDDNALVDEMEETEDLLEEVEV